MILWEVFHNNSWFWLFSKSLDKSANQFFFINILHIVLSSKIIEVEISSIGPLTKAFSYSWLTRSFCSKDKFYLWQNSVFALGIDLSNWTCSINFSDFTKFGIIFNNCNWLINKLLNSLFDSLSIVIWSATSFFSFHASFNHQLLGNIVIENLLGLNDILFKICSLVDCPWESVNKIIFWWRGEHALLEERDGRIEWNKLSFSNDLLNLLSLFGVLSKCKINWLTDN